MPSVRSEEAVECDLESMASVERSTNLSDTTHYCTGCYILRTLLFQFGDDVAELLFSCVRIRFSFGALTVASTSFTAVSSSIFFCKLSKIPLWIMLWPFAAIATCQGLIVAGMLSLYRIGVEKFAGAERQTFNPAGCTAAFILPASTNDRGTLATPRPTRPPMRFPA